MFDRRRPASAPAIAGAGVLAACLLLAAGGPVARAAGGDLTPQVLKARTAVGLPAVGPSAAVRAAVGAVVAGGDAQGAFASAGGKGQLVTATAPAGAALSTAQLKAVVFDPRVTAIAVTARDRTVGVAASLDDGLPFRAPVLAGAVVDPGVPGSLAVLFPPGSGTIPQIALQRYRGGQLTTIEVAATAAPGADGAILVQLKGRDRITGPRIGYGLTYTLGVGSGRTFKFQTRPIPSVLLSHSFQPGPGFTGADRRRFVAAVDTLPPEARKVLDVVGGAITVRVLDNSAPVCASQTSCAGFDPGYGYFMILNRAQLRSPLGRFVITHELGHLVDFLGLDTFSYDAFKKLFSRSGAWKNCFPVNGQCCPFLEVFADQFGFFSTNAHGVQSGYGDARLATGPAYAKLLQVQWAFRPPQDRNPLAGFGPLAKTFEDGMHSAADEL